MLESTNSKMKELMTKGGFIMQVKNYKLKSLLLASLLALLFATPTLAATTNETEDNGNIATADQVNVGNVIQGGISVDGDTDYYKVDLKSSGRLALSMTSYMPYYSMYVYDTQGTELWYEGYNEWNETVGFRSDTYTLDLEKGTYYIKVTGSYSSSTGTYNLNTAFTASGANVAEPNNSIAEAKQVSFGTVAKGQIAINDSYDFYKVKVNSKMKLRIAVNSYMQYYSMYVYDTQGTELWYEKYNEWDESRGRKNDVHYVTLSKGTYYIKITGDGNGWRSCTGNYNFKLSKSANSIKLNKTKVTLSIAKTVKLKATVYPKTGEKVTWSSSDRTVATVSSKGVVKAKKCGYVTITAMVGDQVTKTCEIYIRPKTTKLTKAKGVTYYGWWSADRYADLKWKNIKKASGYEIAQSKYKNKKFKIVDTSYSNTTRIYVNKIGIYYFKVRAYKEANGKKVYGKWSNVKKVTIKI